MLVYHRAITQTAECRPEGQRYHRHDETGMKAHDNDPSQDPESLPLSDAERDRLVSIMLRMMEMGMGAVYGVEDDDVEDAVIDCAARLALCKAKCCTLNFALTREEVERGIIRSNPQRPHFIAKNPDGYCTHLDRTTLQCTVWDERPLRCRRYDCRKDPLEWTEETKTEENGSWRQ